LGRSNEKHDPYAVEGRLPGSRVGEVESGRFGAGQCRIAVDISWVADRGTDPESGGKKSEHDWPADVAGGAGHQDGVHMCTVQISSWDR